METLKNRALHTDGSSAGTLIWNCAIMQNCIMQEQMMKMKEKCKNCSKTTRSQVKAKILMRTKRSPGVFMIRVTGGVKEGVKEVTSDANFKLGIIPQWTGRHGLQEPVYPKEVKKEVKKALRSWRIRRRSLQRPH